MEKQWTPKNALQFWSAARSGLLIPSFWNGIPLRTMYVHFYSYAQTGIPTSLRPASLVYGSTPQTRGKFLYVCDRWPACNAYVSAHERTLLPMGTLANGDLRHKRILAHRALKKLQQDCHMEKWEVYIWLQAKLGLDAHQTHIGQFSEYMCEQVISLCQQAPAYTSGRAA